MAAITKAQWSVVLPPTLLLVWVIDRVAIRAIGGKLITAAAAGSLAVMAAWFVARLVISGPDGFVLDLMRVQESAHWTVFALNPARYLVLSGQYLLKSGIAFVLSAGLLYAGVLVARREEGAKQAVLFASVLLVWLAWYAVVSVGWERYAFEPTVIGAVLAGAGLAEGPRLARQPTRRTTRIAAAVVASVLAVAVLPHSFNRARDLLGPPDGGRPVSRATTQRRRPPGDPQSPPATDTLTCRGPISSAVHSCAVRRRLLLRVLQLHVEERRPLRICAFLRDRHRLAVGRHHRRADRRHLVGLREADSRH